MHRCAVCADFDLCGQRLVVFYVRYVLNDTGLFTVLVLVQPGWYCGIGTAGAGDGREDR